MKTDKIGHKKHTCNLSALQAKIMQQLLETHLPELEQESPLSFQLIGKQAYIENVKDTIKELETVISKHFKQ